MPASTSSKASLRRLLRGEYRKDHPDAIVTEEDMKRKPENEKGE